MDGPIDTPNRLPWPPLLYAAALLVPSLLQWLLPLPALTLGDIVDMVSGPVGLAIAATGVFVAYLGVRSLTGADTPVDPRAAAEHLVTFGPFNQSRNPIYLGAMMLFFGLALATGNIWRWLSLPLLVIGLTRLAIIREEAHLAARFGEAWTDYAARVRRWM